jgi:hypothetical protein
MGKSSRKTDPFVGMLVVLPGGVVQPRGRSGEG